jgi:hypothetical protein
VISSAFSTIDAHHEAVEQGDTDMQYLARLGERGAKVDREQRAMAAALFRTKADDALSSGDVIAAKVNADRAAALEASLPASHPASANVSTWAANPSLSVERTLALEEDFSVWLREYASVPIGNARGFFFDHQLIDWLCIAVPRVPKAYACGIDPGLVTNSFTLIILGFDQTDEWLVDGLELLPEPGAPLDDEESFTTCAELAARWSCKAWTTDGHYIATARRIGRKNGLATILAPTDNWPVFRDFRLAIGRRSPTFGGHATSPRIALQLKSVTSKPLDGRTRIMLAHEAGGAHGDLASAFVRARWLARAHGASLSESRRAAFGALPDPST